MSIFEFNTTLNPPKQMVLNLFSPQHSTYAPVIVTENNEDTAALLESLKQQCQQPSQEATPKKTVLSPFNALLFVIALFLIFNAFGSFKGCNTIPSPQPQTIEQLVATVPDDYRSSVQNAVDAYRNNRDIDEFNERTVAARMKEPEPAQTVTKIRNALQEQAPRAAEENTETIQEPTRGLTPPAPDNENETSHKTPSRRRWFRRE